MATLEEHQFNHADGKETFYLASGPHHGQLIILCHGWPAIAKTWKSQLEALAALGYRVVAPDMPGYGQTTGFQGVEDYSLKNVNQWMASLLAQFERDQAIWIGHDWGAVAVWSFAAHYPEKTTAVAGLARPYHTLELGLEQVLKTVNRDIYPTEDFPYGQYDYQVYFEQELDKSSAWFEQDITGILKAVYAKGNPQEVGKPGLTASVTKHGGWFGGAPSPPPTLQAIPIEYLCVDQKMLDEVDAAMRKTGFKGPNAWYGNHERNREYSLKEWKFEGHLKMPVLFIGANWDPISDVTISAIAESQKEFCANLTDVRVDAGHWVALEKPSEVNSHITNWLKKSVN